MPLPYLDAKTIDGRAVQWDQRTIREMSSEIRKKEEEKRQQLEEHKASIMTGILGSWKYETGTGVALTMAHDKALYDHDESFDVKAFMKEDEEEFPTNVTWEQELLSSAKSEAHYNALKERVRSKREFMLNAEDMGLLPSMGLQLVSEFGNIPNYFSFGLSGLKAASKAKKFFVAGAVTGTANVTEEAFINQMYKDRTATDYIAAGVLGMGLGWLGAGGKSGRQAAHIDEVAENFSNTHMKNSVDEKVADLKGEADIDHMSTVGAEQIRNIHQTFYPDFDPTKTTARMDEDNEFVQGAFHAYLNGDIKQAKDLPHQKIGLASMSQSVHSSENPLSRYMASLLMEYPEGAGTRWNDHTVALDSDLMYTQFISNYAPEYIRLREAWDTLANQSDAKHTFDEAASIRIQSGMSIEGSSKQMDDLLDEFKEFYTAMGQETINRMKKAGVMEAQARDLDPEHLYRGWDSKAVHAANKKHGSKAVIDTFKESILGGHDFQSAYKRANEKLKKLEAEAKAKHEASIKKVEDDLADTQAKLQKAEAENAYSTKSLQLAGKVERLMKKLDKAKSAKPERQFVPVDINEEAEMMAHAFFNRFMNRATVSTADANLLSSANRTLLKDALDDVKMTDAQRQHIDAVLDSMGKDQKANPMKHQTGMDLAYEHSSGLRILDMMNTDLASGYASKTRHWLGRAAAAKKGLKSEADFQEAITQIRRHGDDRGQDPDQIKADVARLTAAWKMIKGEPLEDMSHWGQTAARIVRKAMATSALGKLGIVQSGETGRVLAAVGIQNIFDTIPAFKDIIGDMIDGRLDNAAMKDMEDFALGVIGDDHYMNHHFFRADDFGHKVSKAEKLLDRGAFWLSKASGWHLVYKAQKRYLMQGLAQKWRREFLDGTMHEAQMKDLGVPPEYIDGIKDMLSKHSERITDHEGRYIWNLNLGKWENEDYREAFARMLHRKGSNAVQDIMVGETPLWINQGLGKFLGQFRSFSIAALGKQTVHDYRMHKAGDIEAALAMQFMLMTSTMAVMARVGFDAAVLPEAERKKYLERNLSIGSITHKVLNYHGQASPLVDMTTLLAESVMPNTWGELTGTSMFQNSQGMMNKIPGISYINRAGRGLSGVAQGIMPGEEMSESDWKTFVGVLPLNTWYGFHALNKRVVTPMLFDE